MIFFSVILVRKRFLLGFLCVFKSLTKLIKGLEAGAEPIHPSLKSKRVNMEHVRRTNTKRAY